MVDEGDSESIEIPFHDSVKFVKGQIDPVVSHPILREVVSPNSLRPIAAPHLRLPDGRHLLVRFVSLRLHNAAGEEAHRFLFVLVLAPLFLASDNGPRGHVSDSNG